MYYFISDRPPENFAMNGELLYEKTVLCQHFHVAEE